MKKNSISQVTLSKADNGELNFLMRVVLFVQPQGMDTTSFIKLDFFLLTGMFSYKKEPAALAV